MAGEPDYYQLLGLDRNADEQQIKQAYRKLARKYHPDLNPDNSDWAAEMFKQIQEAYETLIDANKRDHYDRYGHRNLNVRPRRPTVTPTPTDEVWHYIR